MPTPISGPDKAAVISLVAVFDPVEANNLLTTLNTYDDVVNLIAAQAVEFEFYPEYLTEVMAALTNGTALINAGIWVNQTVIGPDAKVIINSTVAGNVAITVNNKGLGIFNSTINKIILSGTAFLSDLWIGSGSSVQMLDSSAAGTFVNNIWLRNIRSAPASLVAVAVGSNINESGINVMQGALYGGITNNNPSAVCAIPVTDLTITDVTNNTLKLTWVNPVSGFVSIDTFYKKSAAPVWNIVDSSIGDYLPGSTGFIFRQLEKDTKYDFKVVVTCNNGGQATTTMSGITVCCSDGTNKVFKCCQVTVEIKHTPGAAVQTLCNNAIIPLEYPEGTTIVMPYLIGLKDQISDWALGGIGSLMPFDNDSGTFDASTTVIATFVEPNVVTFNVNLQIL